MKFSTNQGTGAWFDRLLGGGVGLAAFVTYLMTLSDGPYPGESAALLAREAGLVPTPIPQHPIWTACNHVIGYIPIGTLADRVNFLSAVFGAVSVWLMYRLTSGCVDQTFIPDRKRARSTRIAGRLAGLSAALFLAYAIPFWILSTRANSGTLDVMLLLIVSVLLLRYVRDEKAATLTVFAFLYGLAVVEFATMIVLAPLFGLIIVLILRVREELSWWALTRLAVAALAGLCLYAVAAGVYCLSDSFKVYHTNFFGVVWGTWLDQYHVIRHSIPRQGWMLIAISSIVPCLTAMLVARKALNEERDWSFYILHAVMTIFGLIVLLNLPFSSWRVIGMRRLLAMPYVMSAFLFGYLAAYWFLVPETWFANPESRAAAWAHRWLGPILVAPLVLALCIMPFLNRSDADAGAARLVNRVADEVLDSMNGRTWLVTDGMLDAHIQLRAVDRNIHVELLNLRLGNNPLYLKHVSASFDDPGVRNAATIGLVPMLNEWLEKDPAAVHSLAVMRAADLWVGAELQSVPNKLLFLGTEKLENVAPDALFKTNSAFIKDFALPFKADLARTPHMAGLGEGILLTISQVANNAGVLLEDLKRSADAFAMYESARATYPGNVSALLNEYAMIQAGFQTERREAVLQDLKSLLERRNEYQVWALARAYGYVRAPEAFARLGMTWALSGRRSMAVSGLKRQLGLAADDEKGVIKQTLADVYLMEQKDAQSEPIYKQLLEADPKNYGALLGLARIDARRGDLDQAVVRLNAARQAGAPELPVDLETATVQLMKGQLPEAKALLQKIVDKEPENVRALAMLSELLRAQDDTFGAEQCVHRLASLPRGGGVVALMNAEDAWRKNDWPAARRYYEQALRLSPNNEPVLERLLRLDLIQAQPQVAGAHARRLLTLNTANAFGNYVMGSLHMADGDYQLAEDSFRKSLDARHTPEALNDLAWLLHLRGDDEDAVKYAREAVKLNERIPYMWDTLGVVLTQLRNLDEAEAALEKGLALAPEETALQFHMAELQFIKGSLARARALVESCEKHLSRLSSDEQERLYELKRKLGSEK